MFFKRLIFLCICLLIGGMLYAEERGTTPEKSQPKTERPTKWGEPTQVEVAIYILDIDEINSAQQSFTASVFYVASWKNPLLKHPGPGPLHRRVTEVWTPRLTIVNQQQAWSSFPEYVEIQPDGTNVYRQKVWGSFSQPLNLQAFPLDEQTLSIHITAPGLLEDQVKMIPLVRENRGSGIAQKFSLPDFSVQSWDSKPTPYYAYKDLQGTAGYELQLTVVRRPAYYVLKVILPLCLIVMMSWIPRWIDPTQVGVNMGIAATSFLTLIAYLFAINVLLPKVSYITRMDRFIFLSTILVFAGLAQTTFDAFAHKKNREKLAIKLNFHARYFYPILLALVLLFSFIVR